jgi:hypothetical protein
MSQPPRLLVPSNQPNFDYSKLPKTGREYDPASGMSPDEHFERLQRVAQHEAYAGRTIKCPKNQHWPGNLVFACPHCATQDEQHPQGMILTPYMYYICTSCYTRSRDRKVDFSRLLETNCWECILAEWERISHIDKSVLKDRRGEARRLV